MVLKRLFGLGRSSPADRPSIPPGLRIYAVGDIHGRIDLLEAMLEQIERDDSSRPPADTLLIFLGDLVDRGPSSKQVVQRLLDLRDSGRTCRFLLGNHDEVFLKAASGDAKATRFLTRIGGKETILSYGVSEEDYLHCDFEELARLFSSKVPAKHVAFLKTFENYVEAGDYLFVHAGIRPGVAMADQQPADLRWIRGEFLNCRTSHGVVVVHGHSISDEPEVKKNRIGIDTGAFASGRLTALGLQDSEHWLLFAQGPSDSRWLRPTD